MHLAIELAAEGVPQAPVEVMAAFERRLAALPASLTAAEAYRGEAAGNVAWLHSLEKQSLAELTRPGGELDFIFSAKGVDNS